MIRFDGAFNSLQRFFVGLEQTLDDSKTSRVLGPQG
jgi:hypothetical protein